MKKLTTEQIDDLLNQVADNVIAKIERSNNQDDEHSMICIVSDGKGAHYKLIGSPLGIAKSITREMYRNEGLKKIIVAVVDSYRETQAIFNKQSN